MQCFFYKSSHGDLVQREGKDLTAFLFQQDDFGIHGQIQPDLPIFPGGDMLPEGDMMGTRRQEHRAVKRMGMPVRYSHRAGDRRYQLPGEGSGNAGGFLKIQYQSGGLPFFHRADQPWQNGACFRQRLLIRQDQEEIIPRFRRQHRVGRGEQPARFFRQNVFSDKF